MKCEACHKPTSALYQRSTDEKWTCFDCLPAKDIDRYPGWRKREARKQQHAGQARKNFQKRRAVQSLSDGQRH